MMSLALAAPRESSVRIVAGRLATGSEFVTVSRKAAMAPVWAEVADPATGLPPLAVEMECAAVAQVCLMFEVRFLGLRAISDTVSGDASQDFNDFCEAAADNLWPIVHHVAMHV